VPASFIYKRYSKASLFKTRALRKMYLAISRGDFRMSDFEIATLDLEEKADYHEFQVIFGKIIAFI
jgi:hypothetical protein